jgi:serine/threonine protein kinase
MIGRTIGTYRIIKRVGVGGVGEVFLGEDLMLERPVAIKVMKPELASRPDIVERFRVEAITLAKVNHTHIATVYAFVPQDTDFFLIMEYVRGWTLQHLIEMHRALAPAVAVRLLRQALDGIGFAHRHGVIHRDIKPSNIMLSDDGIIKVMDFGLARVPGAAHVTRTDRFVGTLEYISPEQLRGEEADVRSDLYALGTVLYELVTGHLPFEHHSEYSLIRAKVEDVPPAPRTFAQTLPEDLEGVILKAVSKAPEDRFQSAEAFSLALEPCVMAADEVSSLSALLSAQQQHAAIVDMFRDKKHGSWIRALSSLDGADPQATRMAEASLFSDMMPPFTTSGRKPRKSRTSFLTSALLVALASLMYVFVLPNSPHNPIRLDPHTHAPPVTAPSLPVEPRGAGRLETRAASPQVTRGALSAHGAAFLAADDPVDIESGYHEPNALPHSPLTNAWAPDQPDLFCQAPDDDTLVGLHEMAAPATSGQTFDLDHAYASIPDLARDEAATDLEPESARADDAPHLGLSPLDHALPPESVNPSHPAPSQKTRKRKIDKKPAQRGSGWVIRR